MVRVEHEQRFRVDRTAAFDYITDPAHWPEYWPGLVGEPQLRDAGWRTPGDVARLRMRLAGRTTELTMTLEELIRPDRVRYRSVQPGFPASLHERHFDPLPGGFDYRLVVTVTPRPGWPGLLDRTIVRWAIRRALRRTTAALAPRLAALRP